MQQFIVALPYSRASMVLGSHFAALETANPWFGFTGEYHRNVLRKNLTGSFVELVTAATIRGL